MNPVWGIDWGRFIDVDIRTYDGTAADNQKRLQFAYRIDTSVVTPLSGLPPVWPPIRRPPCRSETCGGGFDWVCLPASRLPAR